MCSEKNPIEKRESISRGGGQKASLWSSPSSRVLWIADEEEYRDGFDLSQQYTVNDDSAADFVRRQDALELAIADEKRPACQSS
jgi:hypothetical protein